MGRTGQARLPVRWTLVGLALLATACTHRPSAPPLDDGPIYRNATAGFRFCRPDGWLQWGLADDSVVDFEGERLLVEYRSTTATEPASLEVTVAAVAPDLALVDYVKKFTRTGEDWRPKGDPEEFRINGEPAVRLVYSLRRGTKEPMREIVAFRRGDRVYFFKGYYDALDTRARREFRSAVETVVW